MYRHFPDEGALFAACSFRWLGRHVPPDPSPWAAIADPEERMRTALSAMYRFYRDGESMVANVCATSPTSRPSRDLAADARPTLTPIAGLLLKGRGERGRRRQRVAARRARGRLRAWRSLARGGLDDEEIVELMVALVRAAGAPRGKLS